MLDNAKFYDDQMVYSQMESGMSSSMNQSLKIDIIDMSITHAVELVKGDTQSCI